MPLTDCPTNIAFMRRWRDLKPSIMEEAILSDEMFSCRGHEHKCCRRSEISVPCAWISDKMCRGKTEEERGFPIRAKGRVGEKRYRGSVKRDEKAREWAGRRRKQLARRKRKQKPRRWHARVRRNARGNLCSQIINKPGYMHARYP